MAKGFMHRAMFVVLPLTLSVAANGQTPAAGGTQAAAVDVEEKLDEGLKSFGYLAGLARTCVATTQQTAMDREIMGINSSITQLLGTDRAFLFSTSFGYGTSVKVDVKDCTEILKSYGSRVAKHRSATGGVK